MLVTHPLSPADRDRLIKLLGMASGSRFEGEALNALRLAEKLLRARQATWSDVVGPSLPTVREDPEEDDGDRPGGGWRRWVRRCRQRGGRFLTAREAEFLGGLEGSPYLSERQGAVLGRIVAKLVRMGCWS